MSDAAILSAPARRRGASGEAITAWALGLPAVLAYLVLLLLPTLAAILLAFTDYELGAPAFAWIGLGIAAPTQM